MAEAFRLNGTPRDFLNFYTGGLLLRQGQGTSLYELELQESTQQSLLSVDASQRLHEQVRAQALPFLNPPFVALMFLPMTHLTLTQAYAVWLVVNIGLLGALAALLTFSFSHWSPWERLIAAAAGLTFLPSYFAVWQGQISLLLALALALSWLAFRKGRDRWGGFALALLLAKPQYSVIPLLDLLWRRRWRALGGYAVGAVLLTLLSVLATGPSGPISWLRLLPQASGLGAYYGIHAELMFTWSGFLSAMGGQAILSPKADGSSLLLVWLALEASTMGAVLLASRAQRATASARSSYFSILLLATIVVSPHTYVQDLTLLLVVGYLTWDTARGEQRMHHGDLWLAGLLGTHVLVLALFLARTAFPAMPYPNVLLVPVMAGWLMLLVAMPGRKYQGAPASYPLRDARASPAT